MGQFKGYVESYFPASLQRAVIVVASAAFVIQAVRTRRLEDIVAGVVFGVLLLPAGIAPKAHRASLVALDRHPVPGTIFTFLLMLGALFALLAKFVSLSRPTSLYIALPAAAVLAAVDAVRRPTRIRAAE
jgi:hypothetical protein